MDHIELNRDGVEHAHEQALDVLQDFAAAALESATEITPINTDTVTVGASSTENRECERRYRSGNKSAPDHINYRDFCGPDL